MDPPRFINHYRGLFTWLRFCGLPTPWLEKPNLFSRVLFLTYDTFVAVVVIYVEMCYIYTFTRISMTFQDLCALGISAGCHICGLFVSMHLFKFRDQLKKITEDMDLITKRIMKSELGQKEYYQQQHYKNSKLMAILTNCSVLVSFITPYFYCLSRPVMEWYSGCYRSNLPVETVSFFNEKSPGLYELMVFLISFSITISTSRKSINDCLFITLFKMQIIFLKYLSLTKRALEKELSTADHFKCQRKLMVWVKLHQDIMKNVEELVLLFSPVVIIYYILVVEIVVCGAFVELMKDNDSIIQSISMCFYVSSTILYYFLLSNTADELTDEARKLGFTEYCLPWYKMDKTNISMVKFVLIMCNKPIKITAYRAPAFLLNRETFAGFMVSAISALVTFTRMKDTFG